MSSPGFFSGPPSNKATASTLAAAAATLFWTIAAHTWWKSMSTTDMTLYIATSTIFLTALAGFVLPESLAYSQHSLQRLNPAGAAKGNQVSSSTVETLDGRLKEIQQVLNLVADGLKINRTPELPPS
jgi:hypothetical protein